MPTDTQRPILFKAEGIANDGQLSVRTFTRRDQIKRAITIWIICWAAAVASIPIILAHYILIPAFLIAGPVLAMKRLRTEEEKFHVNGICPNCDQSTTIKLEKDDQLPKWVYCPSCDKAIELVEK